MREALIIGLRSGRLFESIGVGTATMKNVQACNRLGSAVSSSLVAERRSSAVVSAVSSWPRSSSSMRFCRMSKPTVGSLRPKLMATGNPT